MMCLRSADEMRGSGGRPPRDWNQFRLVTGVRADVPCEWGKTAVRADCPEGQDRRASGLTRGLR